ncbi:MAG: hypothetical protein WBG41_13595, partial [Acidimicrobiales bacterium]
PLDEPSPPRRAPAVDWRLDEHTRLVGRAGVAAARAALTSPANGVPNSHPGTAASQDGVAGATRAEDQAA